MRITHVNSILAGGAARAVQRLHDGLCQQGCDSHIFTLAEDMLGHDWVSRFRSPQNFVSKVNYRLRRRCIEHEFSRYISDRPSGLEPFSDDRSEFRFDVVKQMPDCNLVNLHWIAEFVDYTTFFSSMNIPIVWTLHDMNPFTGGCHYTGDCGGFHDSCGSCPQLGSGNSNDLSHAIWKRKQDAFSSLQSEKMHIVATSQWMKREAQRSSLLKNFPISVIPLALDTKVFFPWDGEGMRSTLGIPKNARVILFAADSIVNRRKGFVELIEALRGLTSKEPLFLLTFGGDEPKLDHTLNHLHVGYVKNDRLMASIYSAADVFVIPSTQEAFGQTALEAMACGTPVIGFSTGGMLDMIRSGETGYLVKVGDISGLRSAMLEERSVLQKMGMACRALVEREYDLCVQAKRYTNLYHHMIEGQS